jgi:hypothetical protein
MCHVQLKLSLSMAHKSSCLSYMAPTACDMIISGGHCTLAILKHCAVIMSFGGAAAHSMENDGNGWLHNVIK